MEPHLDAQDASGTRILLTDDGVTYGDRFVAFDKMRGIQSMPQHMAGEDLCDVTVLLKNGPPDLVIRNLPEDIATPLSRDIGSILRGRYA